jgi:ubiquitin C-terminal hydrolase
MSVMLTGIQNTGNNCYIISALQLLCAMEPLKELVFKKFKYNTDSPLFGFLGIIKLHLLGDNIKAGYYINHYKKLLGFGNGQDDSAVFLNNFLELINNKDIWTTEVKKKLYKFGSIADLHQDIKTHKYVASNLTNYNLIELQFDVKQDSNKFVHELLMKQSARNIYEYTKQNIHNNTTDLPPVIEYNNNKVYEIIDYYCKDYIMVRIQAFDQNHNKKFHNILLCMSNYCIVLSKIKYKLIAVIVHIGSTIHSGHYVCYINDNNIWYRCDDNSVQRVNDAFLNPNRYINELPYVLLYKIVSD